MNKKKILLYASTVIIFLIFCSIYLWQAIGSASTLYGERTKDMLISSEPQIQKNFDYQVKNLLFEFNRLSGQAINRTSQNGKNDTTDESSANNHSAFFDILEELEIIGFSSMYICTENGELYNKYGADKGKVITKITLRDSRNAGYSMLALSNSDGSAAAKIAIVVPISQNDNYYLVRLMLVEEFLNIARSGLTFSSVGYLELFDEWGNPQTAFNSGNPETKQTAESLLMGANAFVADRINNSIQRIGLGQSYNVYVPLSNPKEWFLGLYLDFSRGVPIYSGVIQSSILMFIVWMSLIIVIIALDVINDKEKKKEFFLVSNIDHLTGLINNTGIQSAITSFIQDNQMNLYSLVCMDIVAFSRINAMFGYSVGDMLLRVIANAIKEHYFCGTRTSGDKFSFFALSSPQLTSDIEEILYDYVEKQLGKEYMQMVAFKFGVYPIYDIKPRFRDICDGALLALKEAKKQKQQREVIYNKEMSKSENLRKSIEINMIHALSKEEFLVYIHPQYEAKTGRCCGGEALVRWQSEFMGFLPPDKFIPLFESNGFIVEIDFFMLEAVLRYLQDRFDHGQNLTTIAVNQSKVTISFPNYYERLKDTIKNFSVPLKYVEIEVTESVLENDMNLIVPLIHSIKRLGFCVAMDDFGSGFSSLNTLRMMPIDILKIDKGFLNESDASARSGIIIKSVVVMAKELNMKIVCEGVETEEQVNFLREIGCDIIQGYFYSKPIPLSEFAPRHLDSGEMSCL